MSFHEVNKGCECVFNGPLIGSAGPEDAEIVIIGEAPVYGDKRTGKPFSGPVGNLLKMNLPHFDDYLLMNAVECVPINATKEKKMPVAVGCCKSNTIAKIQAYPRKGIITLGNYAMHAVLGDPTLKIGAQRGKCFDSPYASTGVYPVYHPMALARGTGSYRQWQDDLMFAVERCHGIQSRKYVKYEEVQITTVEQAMDVIELFRNVTEGTCDIETTGFNWRGDRILQIGLTADAPTMVERAFLFYPEHFHLLEYVLKRTSGTKWSYHNGKFDVKFLRDRLGIDATVDDDTMLMRYVLNEEGGIHDLDTVAADLLDAPDHKNALKPYLKKKGSNYGDVPRDILANYHTHDMGKQAQIKPILRRRIAQDKNLERLYTELLLPASEYLAWVETNGIYVDTQKVEENQYHYTDIQKTCVEELAALGHPINPGSPKQVADMLYNKLRLPNRWKGGTGADILKKLEPHSPQIIKQLLLYRTAAKMNGTYCRGWLKHIHPDDGRIHTTYKIHGTRTGRLSSSEPNIQNIPRLARIRGQVVAAPGYIMIEKDYSQAELRLLAALSGDPVLCDIFNSGGDPHSDLAESLFPGWHERDKRAKDTGDAELKALCKEQRTKCKNVNFGIVYGITEFGLAEQIKDTPAAARAMLNGWAMRYKIAHAFIKSCRMTVIRNQVMTTCFGRKKRNGVVSRMNLAMLENEAANFPPQSIASDFTLLSGIRVWRELRDMGVKIVNTVHDSIIMEAPVIHEGDFTVVDPAIRLVTNTMRSVPNEYGIAAVPFDTDAEIGHRWGALEGYNGYAT